MNSALWDGRSDRSAAPEGLCFVGAMVIRTGILHVPAIDEEAGAAVRLLLQTETPEAVVLVESYAADQRIGWRTLRRWCDEEELDLVLTVGGTMPAPGPSGRQIVPDAAARWRSVRCPAWARRCALCAGDDGPGADRPQRSRDPRAHLDPKPAGRRRAGDALSRGGDRGDRVRVRSPAGIALRRGWTRRWQRMRSKAWWARR